MDIIIHGYCGQPQVNFYYKIFCCHFYTSVNSARSYNAFNAEDWVAKDLHHTTHDQLWFTEPILVPGASVSFGDENAQSLENNLTTVQDNI